MVGAPRPLSPWPPKRAVGPSAGSAFGASRMCRRIAFSPSCRASWRRGRQSTPTDGAGIPGWRTLATSTRSPSSATVWIQPTKSCRGFILSPRFSSGGFSALIRAAASNNTSITTSTNSFSVQPATLKCSRVAVPQARPAGDCGRAHALQFDCRSRPDEEINSTGVKEIPIFLEIVRHNPDCGQSFTIATKWRIQAVVAT